MNTRSVAVDRVLVASTRSLPFDLSNSARLMLTVSKVDDCGFIARLAERDVLFKVAVIVALVEAETCLVPTVKLAWYATARHAG